MLRPSSLRAAILLSLVLAACESGDTTQLGESPVGGSGVTIEPGASGGGANAAGADGAAGPSASDEGAATRDVALDTPNAAPTATVGAILDAGRAPDSGLASDAGLIAADAGPAPLPANDCCSTSGSGGCADPAVAACVCEGDPACCESKYDDLCVNQAESRCGQDCDDRAPVSDCCGASDVPGCTVPEVADCICAIDPFCCVFRFDQNCVNLGSSQCDSVCGEESQP
jgi:hypothetical protein